MLNVWSGRECLAWILEGGSQAARGETRFNLAQLGSRCKQKPLTQKPELHTQLQNTHGFSLQGCWNTKFDSGNFARMNSNCSEIFSLNCGICESLGVRHWWSGRLEGWAHRRLWNVSSLAYYLSLCHCFCLISPRFRSCISRELKVADLDGGGRKNKGQNQISPSSKEFSAGGIRVRRVHMYYALQ